MGVTVRQHVRGRAETSAFYCIQTPRYFYLSWICCRFCLLFVVGLQTNPSNEIWPLCLCSLCVCDWCMSGLDSCILNCTAPVRWLLTRVYMLNGMSPCFADKHVELKYSLILIVISLKVLLKIWKRSIVTQFRWRLTWRGIGCICQL